MCLNVPHRVMQISRQNKLQNNSVVETKELPLSTMDYVTDFILRSYCCVSEI